MNLNIKAIFFDMDNTLVPYFSGEEFFIGILKKLGFSFEIEQVKSAYQSLEPWASQNLADYTSRNRKTWVEYNRRRLEVLGVKEGVVILAEKVQDYWERLPQEIGEELYPEVREVLDSLSKNGFLLGVLSNRDPEIIRNSVMMHGIAGYFRCLISPQEAKAPNGKLDRQMWEVALRAVGVIASEAAHVGDLYEHDVIGARQAGLLPILIDRKGRYDNDNVDCIKIRNLNELFRVVQIR